MFIKDLLFPKVCLGCGFLGTDICLKCRKQLKYLKEDKCFYCQKKSYRGLTHLKCQKNKGIDGFIGIFYYDSLLKKIIKNIKYRLVKETLKELFLSINFLMMIKINFYTKTGLDFYLQPIPLNKGRLNERGFNQAKIIGQFLQKLLPFSLSDVLERKRNTRPQAQLIEIKQRNRNIKRAFQIKDKSLIKNKNFILIDDIVTSGATVSEATRVLKQAGAQKVFVFALAKG